MLKSVEKVDLEMNMLTGHCPKVVNKLRKCRPGDEHVNRNGLNSFSFFVYKHVFLYIFVKNQIFVVYESIFRDLFPPEAAA